MGSAKQLDFNFGFFVFFFGFFVFFVFFGFLATQPKSQEPKSQEPKSQEPKSQEPKYLYVLWVTFQLCIFFRLCAFLSWFPKLQLAVWEWASTTSSSNDHA